MKAIFRTKFISLIFLLFPLLGLATDYPAFAIIGDTRIGQTESVYKEFLDKTKTEGVSLIFHTGDVINRPGEEKEWKRFLELNGTGRTVLIAPGNHDISNNISLKTYEKYISQPPYFSHSIGDTQFILLCTDLPGQKNKITGEQFEWLKQELGKPFVYRLVFLHKPVFSTTFGKGLALDRYEQERNRLHELLVKNNVSLVAAGHEHLYNRTGRDGITYVITGGGGASLTTFQDEYGGFFHYVLAKRTNGGYVFSVFNMQGKVKDQFYIKRGE